MLFFAAASSGALPLFGTGWGSGGSTAYTNAMHQDLLIQQAMQNDHLRAEGHRRRVSGVGLAVIGMSLLVIGFVVAG